MNAETALAVALLASVFGNLALGGAILWFTSPRDPARDYERSTRPSVLAAAGGLFRRPPAKRKPIVNSDEKEWLKEQRERGGNHSPGIDS